MVLILLNNIARSLSSSYNLGKINPSSSANIPLPSSFQPSFIFKLMKSSLKEKNTIYYFILNNSTKNFVENKKFLLI